jgi:hypothetical protein
MQQGQKHFYAAPSTILFNKDTKMWMIHFTTYNTARWFKRPSRLCTIDIEKSVEHNKWWFIVTQGNYRVRHLMLQFWAGNTACVGCGRGCWRRWLGFSALDSVNNEMFRPAAYIFYGTVHVKQVDRIRAASVSSEILWWSATCSCTFKKNNWSVGASVTWN